MSNRAVSPASVRSAPAGTADELRRLLASLQFSWAGAGLGPEQRASHLSQAARVMELQGARVTLRPDGLQFHPVEGHPHPLNRLAAALASQSGAELLYDGQSAGLSHLTQPPSVGLVPNDLRGGPLAPETQGAVRSAFSQARATGPTAGLWDATAFRDGFEDGTPASTTQFDQVRRHASELNRLSTQLRRDGRAGGGRLTTEGWEAASALRSSLAAFRACLDELRGVALEVHSAFQAGEVEVSHARSGEGSLVGFMQGGAFVGEQATVPEGPATGVALETHAERLRAALERLGPRVDEALRESDPGRLAVRVADLVQDIGNLDRAHRGEDPVSPRRERRPAGPVEGDGGAQATGLDALRGALDFAFAGLRAGTTPVAEVLDAAARVLDAHGVSFERSDERLVILPGDGSPLNRRAQNLAYLPAGITFEPLELVEAQGDALFISEGTGPLRHRIALSCDAVRSCEWDSNCEHELEHLLETLGEEKGERGLWKGHVVVDEAGEPLSFRLPYLSKAYGHFAAFHELLAYSREAVVILEGAVEGLRAQGPDARAPHDAAAIARLQLRAVAEFAVTFDGSVRTRQADPRASVELSPLSDFIDGNLAHLRGDTAFLMRSLGEAVDSRPGPLRGVMDESLQALLEALPEVMQRALDAAALEDIPAMAIAARALYDWLREADRAHGGSRDAL